MKFPRNARIFRGQLDVAPFAGVFFLLVMFLLLSALVYTPGGVPLQLPRTDDLPGPDKPTVAVAVDANGRLYFGSLSTEESELTDKLRKAASDSAQPLTLIVQADKAVTYDTLVHLWSLARTAGISNLVLATLPRPFSPPARAPRP
jgi:biopolymer transport protein ExbD